MSETILYSYFRSSAAYRVRIALNLKEVPYEYRPVHLVNNGGEQNLPDYRKLNPSGEVPTFIHNGKSLSQSMAIIQYLDDVFPNPPLFPKDPYEKAHVLQICEIINSGIQPLGNLKVLHELEKRASFDQKMKSDWSSYWIARGLDNLEKHLQGFAGSYCFGNQITAADLFLVPQIYNAHRHNVSLNNFPLATRIYRSCSELAPFQKASPEAQPDAPKMT